MPKTDIDEIAAIIRENCARSKVKYCCVERIEVTCNTEDAADTIAELRNAGFNTRHHCPRDKSAAEMKVNTLRTIITAERKVAKGKA